MEKTKKRLKRGELTKIILMAIAGTTAAAALTAALVVVPGLGLVIKSFADWYEKQNRYKQHRIRKTFEALRIERFVSSTKVNQETKIILTDNGKKKILQYNFEDLKIPAMKKWDKKWRIVIFDIPENQKSARHALRIKLSELGFYQLQKSVWLYPYECRDEIDFIIEFFGISQYVRVVEAYKFDGDEIIKRKFDLKF